MEFEHLQSVLLPEDEGPLGVGLRVELLSLDEAELQLGLQHLPHELRANIQACIFLDLIADQLGAADGLAFPSEAADRFLDR